LSPETLFFYGLTRSIAAFLLQRNIIRGRSMYLVLLAWIYVALMMAVVEATSSIGTVTGALFTFVLYGVAPVSLVMYVMATPHRKRALKAREAAEFAARAAASNPPDAGSEAAADAVAPVRKEG
jgi:hypothetical protein